MAAASPIIINTSSPQSFRIPSITPPSLRRDSDKLDTSSPQLPSPSTFIKPRPSALKSGSRAQPIPEGAKAGFASAGSLWREKRFDVEDTRDWRGSQAKAGGEQQEPVRVEAKPKEVKRKLMKPKKKAKDSEANNNAAATLHTQPDIYDVPVKVTLDESAVNRKNDLRLSEFAYEHTTEPPDTVSGKGTSAPPKKSRKHAPKPAKAAYAGISKKPRKRKAKSDAVILNSDEPEVSGISAVEEAARGKINVAQSHPPDTISKEVKTKKPRARKAKASTEKAGKANEAMPEKSAYFSKTGPSEQILPECNTVEHEALCEAEYALEKSSYFIQPAMMATEQILSAPSVPVAELSAAIDATVATETGVEYHPIAELASRRRRSWTPAKDTKIVGLVSGPAAATLGESDASPASKVQLKDILCNFSYVSGGNNLTASADSEEAGEPATKKRRIELTGTASVAISAPKEPVTTTPKPAKRTKQPKKARTITALATAAFQPAQTSDVENGTMLAYFAPQEGDSTTAVAPAPEDCQTTNAKPKKPRKPRVSKSAAAEGSFNQPVTAAKTKKATSAKKKKAVKFNEADYLPRLYSPIRAYTEIKKQDFLFGSSSQLAPADSPDFIRDLQAAVRESENATMNGCGLKMSTLQGPSSSMALGSPINALTEKSCVSVPIAPHGTNLSVAQAERGLWCAAARDSDGALFQGQKFVDNEMEFERSEGVDGDDMQAIVRPIASNREVEREENAEHSVAEECPAPLEEAAQGISNPVVEQEQHTEPCAADQCSSPPGLLPLLPEESVNAHSMLEMPGATDNPITDASTLPSAHSVNEDDDSWMLLSSSEPKSIRRSPGGPFSPLAIRTTKPSSPRHIESPSKFVASTRFRPALRPLDSNLSLAFQLSPGIGSAFSQKLPISSTAPDQARALKRPRGRPRKDAPPIEGVTAAPKRRGRPPKLSTTMSDVSTMISKPTKTKATMPASEPAPQAEWLDIDEISDSDDPDTPSPPRRRASSSPPAVQPLQLSPSKSVADDNKVPLLASAGSLKPDGPQWPTMREALFPLITASIKSTPRGMDSNQPSWWEKILLYDPIVVEDLTDWLNEQGLHVEVKKPRVKKKGGKKKAIGPEDSGAIEADWELLKEPLQSWMVQKWCEENSICCYTKNGGWRGGRLKGTRY